MTKLALTAAAAILVATGTAFAGSDHYGSDNVNQPAAAAAANVDNTFTGSIRKPVTSEHTGAKITSESVAPESGQGIWGR
ncbi:DUF680 domain-containing protein [Mesorhizobium sp. C280B]|uniref:DUF680 domain-containing protein n=1 Tax=unclassified Mesorhizobium TaxID=325217 RepID=UPI0003CE0506|nr:DUF680 domain-containing protein [Mesorhizobium sp. LSJC280B00]ESW82996.1 hypothetical protein X772_19205 [Mesorhizobium sp. LSJC280B00]